MFKFTSLFVLPVLAALTLVAPCSPARAEEPPSQMPAVRVYGPFFNYGDADATACYWRSQGHQATVVGPTDGQWYVNIVWQGEA